MRYSSIAVVPNKHTPVRNSDRARDEFFGILFIVLVAVIAWHLKKPRRRLSTVFGGAAWATDKMLEAAGFLGQQGLLLGWTLKGRLMHLPRYVHILIVGAPGTGKGVSWIIPWCLSYRRGSLVAFSTKPDLIDITARHRREKLGNRVIILAPYSANSSRLNPLDLIRPDDRLLVEKAKALGESLVIRDEHERDRHWGDKAAQLISAVLVGCLKCFAKEARNLSSVADTISDPTALLGMADTLEACGGIPARMGK
jgi:type IV secretion system protein VirD4